MKARILRNSILVVLIPILLLFLLLASTAKGQDILGKIFFDPMAWLVVLLLVIIAAALNYTLSWQLLRPINDLDPQSPEDTLLYPEFSPLLRRLREQNLTIRQQFDELSRQQRDFKAITENMSEGFLLLDARANILLHNASALRILGVSAENMERNVRHLNRSNEFREAVDSALTGEHATVLLNLDERCYQLIANPVAENGQITGAVLVILDVTEREQREELRREFTANVSHELKTPLTSISGFAELIQHGLVEPDKIKEFAGDIHTESRRLINLVEDIINISQLEEAQLLPEKEPVDLRAVCVECMERLETAARINNVEMRLEGASPIIMGSAKLLHDMIYNLCDNGIKYNRPGGTLTIKIESVAGGARLSVSDTGIGIPRADQERVFERFYRVDKSHSKAIGGTGLGLSIVKHGAQFHDATIKLESEPDIGTTITLEF